jgi:hypothetical protein
VSKNKEFDTRAVAKQNAEYITPEKLRQFLAQKITKENITVLEPAIGSGQLLFEIKERIALIDGYDVNQSALNCVKENFEGKINVFNQDFITSTVNKTYDYAIANYPFSLPMTEEQKEFIANDDFLQSFFVKKKQESTENLFEAKPFVKPDNVNGKLDFMFILKSFQYAKEGLYFCFPGIAYRGQEEKFRKYLIENKFIKEFGIINNCKFDHTQIPILFLHLTKEPNEKTMSFSLDLKTDEFLEEVANFEDFQFTYPQKQIEKTYFNAVEVEKQARQGLLKIIGASLEYSQMIYNLDPELQKNLPTMEEYKMEIIEILNNEI